MDEGQTFNLPEGYDHRQLIDDLTDHFSIKPDRSVSESFVFYDTFDWRLFAESLVLYRAGNKLFLRRLSSADIIQSSSITTQPVFYWDFPEGELKELLSSIIEMRALLELAEAHTRSTTCRLLNEDEKVGFHGDSAVVCGRRAFVGLAGVVEASQRLLKTVPRPYRPTTGMGINHHKRRRFVF